MHTSRRRCTSLVAAALIAVAASAASGCTINIGGSSSTTTVPKTSTSVEATSSTPPEQTPSSSSTPTTTVPTEPQRSRERAGGTPVDVTRYLLPESSEFVGFTSPSGKIRCNIGRASSDVPAFARCDVYDYTYTPPPRPADCDLEWGPAIGIDGFLCAGDAVNPGPVLPYGSAVTFGLITCASREDGVTCVDAAERGRGFRVARGSYDLF